MDYTRLKKIADTNIDVSKKIYICNFLTCSEKKIRNAQISLVRNLFSKYVVTKWLDYEYGKFLERKEFNDKNLAAAYAWQLYENL